MKIETAKFYRLIKPIFNIMLCSLLSCTSDVTSNDSDNSNGGGDDSNTAPLVLDLSFCDDLKTVSNGRLCAIQPSKTDVNIRDFSINENTPGPGLGYHAIGIPKDWNKLAGVWVHFTGSYGAAYLPSTDEYSSEVWIKLVLQLPTGIKLRDL